MFKRKRKIDNSPGGYEKIGDGPEEEHEDERYAGDSPDDVSVDSPIIPPRPEEVPAKYV